MWMQPLPEESEMQFEPDCELSGGDGIWECSGKNAQLWRMIEERMRNSLCEFECEADS